jgi:4-hydroxy-tetrahydrodipicolinate synthase
VGTTGESPTLDHEEHMAVIHATVKQAAGRVPVIAGTGSNSTTEAVSLTQRAHEAGVDGMLVVAPYYNKPSQEGLFRHYCAIADATDKPIVLYSIPGRCGIEIGVPTIVRLRERYPHVNHIKEAGGSVDRIDQLRSALGDSMVLLSGDDSLTIPFLSVGARGVISVASNLVVRDLGTMVRSALANDFAGARAIHARYYNLMKTLFVEPNPVPIKFALRRNGIIGSEEVRAPLCPMSDANRKLVEAALQEVGL